jgi:microcystin-dependent protein
MFSGNFAPFGWATCDGQIIAISQNTALFSILGTFYGGNGTTTFGLPDMRGRSPIGQGDGSGLSPYVIGELAGTENTSLNSTNIPSHTHLVNGVAGGGQTTPVGNLPGAVSASSAKEKIYSTNAPTVTFNSLMIGTNPGGGSTPFNIMQPYLCVTFIIELQGIFPSRG